MTMKEYTKLRNSGKTPNEIATERELDEWTSHAFELGYTCYLKKLPLDKAIAIITATGYEY